MKTIDYGKCGKYLSYMFWMLIPNIIAGMFANDYTSASAPGLYTVGIVIKIICMIAYAYFLWQLQTEERLYKMASLLSLAAAVWSVIDEFFLDDRVLTLLGVVFNLIGLALSLAQKYFLYEAHSEITYEIDHEQSLKWLKLRKRYMIALGLVGIGLILLFIPAIAAICALVGGIMMFVFSIMELVYLYRTAQVCKKQQYEL